MKDGEKEKDCDTDSVFGPRISKKAEVVKSMAGFLVSNCFFHTLQHLKQHL